MLQTIIFIILLIFIFLIISSSGCLQWFPTSLLRMSSNHCLICHGASSTNRRRCRTRCADRSLMPAAPLRATISTVMITSAVITAARQSRRSNGSSRGRGGFSDAGRPCGTAWHCQPPRARRLAAAGPPDYQPSLARRPFTTMPFTSDCELRTPASE